MKKFIASIAVCGFAFAFVACGAKKEEATTGDTTKVEQAPAPVAQDTTGVDTVKTDTTAAH